MRARLGAHRDARHAGQGDQPVRQLIDHGERALDRILRLERMDVGKARHPGDFLVEPRIVLHRAAAEREQAKVDRVILPAEPRIMAHRLGLAEAGDAHRAAAFETGQPVSLRRQGPIVGACVKRCGWVMGTCLRRCTAPIEIDAGRFGRADFEDQRFFEHQRAIARAGGRRLACDARHFGLPAAGIDPAHDNASSSAEASASISSIVVVSVTATSRPFCRSALSA